MGMEYELKFRATQAQLSAVDAATDGCRQILHMHTTYYDTPSGSLSLRRLTLRKRLENQVSVCTLKTPEKDGFRGEWEVFSETIEQAIPELCKQSNLEDLPVLVQEGLIPICGARFTRTAKIVCLPDCVVELALDAGDLTGGNQSCPLWEVEVELKSGDPTAAAAFAAKLAAEFGLEPEPRSKFSRALALYKGE